MKASIRQYLKVALVLLFTSLFLYAVFRVLLGGWNAYRSLSDNVQIAIAGAVVSLFGTLGSLMYTKIKDRQLQIEASHTANKQKLYDSYTSSLIKLISDPKKANDSNFSLKMRTQFMSSAFLWANPKVLQAYQHFRITAQHTDSDAIIMKEVASLFLAFREDLGLSNKDINEQTLMEILYDQELLTEWGYYGVIEDSAGSEPSAQSN